jgi:6-phosphogluconolactonase
MDADIVVAPHAQALAREAAGRFADLSLDAVERRGCFSAALAGGSTPRAFYELLADDPYREWIPWTDVHLFWGDERCVPPDDPGSNFRMADDALIARVPIPADNVHRVCGEVEPEAAARAYERELRDFFGPQGPRFDLVLLGLGQDGHTASLFPGSSALRETARLVIAVQAHYQGRPAQRVTLTLPTINSARHVWFLVAGPSKAVIVEGVLQGPAGQFPAQLIHPHAGQVTWLLDAGAASRL